MGKVEIILKGHQSDVIDLMAMLKKKGINCSWTKQDLDTEAKETQHVSMQGFTICSGHHDQNLTLGDEERHC